MMRALAGALVLAAALGLTAKTARADTVNVLWYTGGVQTDPSFASTDYKPGINGLITQAASSTVHNSWNITYWDSGSMPSGSYDVLVVASPEGSWSTYPNYSALTSASLTLGDRVMLTGQDADYHYLDYPGTTPFNGPQGFLIDAINWAGTGTGMGAVFLGVRDSTTLPSSVTGYGTFGSGSDTVLIPGAYSTFPINQGLTSAGLSNWSTSSHTSWSSYDTSLWTGINTTSYSTDAVTLVTAKTASAPTSAPEPAELLLLGIGGLFVGLRRKYARH